MSQQEKNRYYTRQELEGMKFRKLGQDVPISRTSRIYIPEYILIDDFCILSGNVEIGKNVYVAHGCRVIDGRRGIIMADFLGVADTYSGQDVQAGAELFDLYAQ